MSETARLLVLSQTLQTLPFYSLQSNIFVLRHRFLLPDMALKQQLGIAVVECTHRQISFLILKFKLLGLTSLFP
jgi:hypothetical protein